MKSPQQTTVPPAPDPFTAIWRSAGGHLAVVMLALLLTSVIPPRAYSEDFSWMSIAEEAVATLKEAALHQAAGDAPQGKRAITRAYFEVFEGKKMEAAIRKMLGESHAFMVERQFGKLRRSLTSAPPDEFGQTVSDLAGQLRADAKQLDALGVPQEVYDAR